MDKEIFGLAAGDAATWVLTFIGMATLFAAIGAWRSSSKLLKVEQIRDEQAQQISAWAEPELNSISGGSYATAGVHAVVNNPTNLPIYAVSISWERVSALDPKINTVCKWEEFKTEAIDLVPPQSRFEFMLDNLNFDEVSGGDISSQAVGNYSIILEKSQAVANQLRIAVRFKDALDQRWERLSNGKLQRI